MAHVYEGGEAVELDVDEAALYPGAPEHSPDDRDDEPETLTMAELAHALEVMASELDCDAQHRIHALTTAAHIVRATAHQHGEALDDDEAERVLTDALEQVPDEIRSGPQYPVAVLLVPAQNGDPR